MAGHHDNRRPAPPGDAEPDCDNSTRRRQCDRAIQALELHMADVQDDVKEIKALFEKYVTQHEFVPVRVLAYGFAGLLLTAVVSAMIAMVLTK